MRLIDADVLKEVLAGKINNELPKALSDTAYLVLGAVSDCISIIGQQPTIDPVKYGKWEELTHGVWDAKCSECGYCIDGYDFIDSKFPLYCANCGAKMWGDADDERQSSAST